MWRYTIKCLACGLERMTYPQDVSIGPLHQEVITGREITPEGLSILKTEPLYRGRTSLLHCPFCELKIHIAVDLAPQTLREYITYQAKELASLALDRIFEINDVRCTLRAIPVDCPRCAKLIDRPNADRLCVDCGGAQVQLIRTENVQET